ncbi:MAG: ARMT1-like domain-containing protein [bacterium]|nr:ARMT1-like domain-containing protein [bacterium]
MITTVECLPCLLRQAIDTMQRFDVPLTDQQAVMQEIMYVLSTMDVRQSAPAMAQRIHRLIRVRVGDDDPYRAIKDESNALALELLPRLREGIHGAEDPLASAIRVAIAGNIIDYGARRQVEREDIDNLLTRSLAMSLDERTLDAFNRDISSAGTILYLADNAGEIAFDRLLIECLPREKVTLAVRGAPIINDATRVDAEVVGLEAMVRIIDNGTDIPGTLVERCTPVFQRHFSDSDVVIAKGQGNFETLAEAGRPIYHLFVAKCSIVADAIGCQVDTPVFQCRGPLQG